MDIVNIKAQVKNYKFSIIVNVDIFLWDVIITEDHLKSKGLSAVIARERQPSRNFQIIKKGKLCFTFFQKSRVVGITGIKHTRDYQEALNILPTLVSKVIEVKRVQLDNITASGSLNFPVKVKDFIARAREREEEVIGKTLTRKRLSKTGFGDYIKKGRSVPFVKYNPSIFPGGYILTDFGTIAIFYSGKYNLIGCPCKEDCEKLEALVFEFAEALRPSKDVL